MSSVALPVNADSAPLTSDQVLSALLNHEIQILQQARGRDPSWVPKLPTSFKVDLRRKDLSGMDLRGIDFSGLDLTGANLSHSRLDDSNFSNSNLLGARLNKATLGGARFLGAHGLFGKNRARFSSYQEEVDAGIESAIFRKPGDHLPWSILRSITTLRIFGASYILMIVLVGYAGLVEWINDTAYKWASIVPAKGEYTQQFRQMLQSQIPLIEVAPHFGIQLLMVLCLALGATIYEIFCPDLIKENTESRWTRELNQSLVEYRSADASRPRARTAAFFFYGIGSLYTLAYGAVKVVHATLYFLGVLGGVYL